MSEHVHLFRLTNLTSEEAASLRHPYYREGSPVFICMIPSCLIMMTGSPMIDAKRPRRAKPTIGVLERLGVETVSLIALDLDGKPFCPTGSARRYHAIGECECFRLDEGRLGNMGGPINFSRGAD